MSLNCSINVWDIFANIQIGPKSGCIIRNLIPKALCLVVKIEFLEFIQIKKMLANIYKHF